MMLLTEGGRNAILFIKTPLKRGFCYKVRYANHNAYPVGSGK